MSAVKTFNLEDLQAHKTREDLYILISGKVYDATEFLDEVSQAPPTTATRDDERQAIAT